MSSRSAVRVSGPELVGMLTAVSPHKLVEVCLDPVLTVVSPHKLVEVGLSPVLTVVSPHKLKDAS